LGVEKRNGEKSFKGINNMMNLKNRHYKNFNKNSYYQIFKSILGLIMPINYDIYRPISGKIRQLAKL